MRFFKSARTLVIGGTLLLIPLSAFAEDETFQYDYSDPSYPATEGATPSQPAAPVKPSKLTTGFPVENEVPPTASEENSFALPTPSATAPALEETPQQPPSPTPQAGPSPTPLPPLPKAVETLLWEASLAENSHALSKSEGSKLTLIAALERAVGPLCMPEIHQTLRYDGKPSDSRCLEYLDKIAALDPENAMVLCARDGIDAKSCRAAFAGQKVTTFIPGASSIAPGGKATGSLDLDERLTTSKNEPKLQAITTRISNMEHRLRTSRSLPPEEMKKLRDALHEALALACRITKLEFEGEAVVKPADQVWGQRPNVGATPTQPPLFPGIDNGKKKKNPFDEVLEQFGGPSTRPVTTDSSSGRIRVRKITDRCKTFVDRALKIDRTLPLPVCYRDGFYAPTCIDARRKFKSTESETPNKSDAPNGGTSGSSGFSSF